MTELQNLTLNIEGMHCASCVHSIEKGLSSFSGVTRCNVNLATRSASVEYQSGQSSERAIIDKIKSLGYTASQGQDNILTAGEKEAARARQQAFIGLALAAPLMVIAMWPMLSDQPLVSPSLDIIMQAILAAGLILLAGKSIVADAWTQTIHGRANMNSLIAMGSLTAFGWSVYALVQINKGNIQPLYFESAGMIIALVLLGRYFEAKSQHKSGAAIQALMKLRPQSATAIINGVEVEIDAGAVRVDMDLLVKPGERVPADGIIIEGEPAIDESMLTGESMPVEKSTGTRIIGGSVNGNSPFKMKVSITSEKSYLSSIIRMVSEAQSRKAPIQKLADRVSAIFVPIVIGIALLTLMIWWLLAPDNPLMIRSVISVLIVACPCALGLATPTAVLVATGRAAKEGIIVRGGEILEKLTEIDSVIFDKTGTLTYGELKVALVESTGRYSEQNLLRMVASAEKQSGHPVAEAIVRHAESLNLESTAVSGVETFPGLGLSASCDGREVLIGNRSFFEERGLALGPLLLAGQHEMDRGRTVVFVAVDTQVEGMITLADHLRSESGDLINYMKLHMNNVTMLTGDNRRTAEGVAKALGLKSFEAEIRPDQKRLAVDSYCRAGNSVAMIGDGINDAPALAAADVGIAIGSGTDVAIETADVILVSSDLMQLARLFSLSQATMKTIRQNLFWAFFYNVLAIPLAAGLFYPGLGWSMTPMVAAVAMSFSSLFVLSNSLRLARQELT